MGLVQERKAINNKRAIKAGQRKQVCNRADSSQFQLVINRNKIFLKKFGQLVSKNPGNGDAGNFGGVNNGQSVGRSRGRLVMIGNNNLNPQPVGGFNLAMSNNPLVNSHD